MIWATCRCSPRSVAQQVELLRSVITHHITPRRFAPRRDVVCCSVASLHVDMFLVASLLRTCPWGFGGNPQSESIPAKRAWRSQGGFGGSTPAWSEAPMGQRSWPEGVVLCVLCGASLHTTHRWRWCWARSFAPWLAYGQCSAVISKFYCSGAVFKSKQSKT